jgi:hypothetical protein
MCLWTQGGYMSNNLESSHQDWLAELLTPKETDPVNYITKPKQRVDLPKVHCKQCHYTATVRTDVAPEACSNKTGFVDADGAQHPACSHRRLWYKWPEGFNPDNCKCLECLIIWEKERHEVGAGKMVKIKTPVVPELEKKS